MRVFVLFWIKGKVEVGYYNINKGRWREIKKNISKDIDIMSLENSWTFFGKIPKKDIIAMADSFKNLKRNNPQYFI
jgi:hypothetical protein